MKVSEVKEKELKLKMEKKHILKFLFFINYDNVRNKERNVLEVNLESLIENDEFCLQGRTSFECNCLQLFTLYFLKNQPYWKLAT